MNLPETVAGGGNKTLSEKRLDILIEADWRVLESGFDERAFQHWRRHAFACMRACLGPDHTYTEYFRNRMTEPEVLSVLSGVGVLMAATMGSLPSTTLPITGTLTSSMTRSSRNPAPEKRVS